MKISIVSFFLFWSVSLLVLGDDSKGLGGLPEVVVSDPSHNGLRVVARDNYLFLEGGNNSPLKLSEAFSTPDTDWRPTGAVLCSWSPNGKYLAVFAPHPRATDVTFVDLRKMVVLPEVFPSNPNYPEWYNNVFSTQDSPGDWDGDKLKVTSNVTLRNGEKRTMQLQLVSNGTDFSMVMADAENQNNGK